MHRRLRYCVFLLALLLCAEAGAWVGAVVESRTILRGETNPTVGVFISNPDPLAVVVLPLEVREVDSGTYVAWSFNVAAQGRVAGSGLFDFLTVGYALAPEPTNSCSGPISQSYPLDSPFPFLPRAVLWSGVVTLSPFFAAGTDGTPGSGTPSFLFTFDDSATSGTVEIDTCCFSPATHFVLLDLSLHPPRPFFTKGVITFSDSCACAPHLAALAWEGVDMNIGHVTEIIDVAFREYEPVSERCRWIFTDVNCDGVTDVFDAVRMINIVYRGEPPLTQFCNPCETAP